MNCVPVKPNPIPKPLIKGWEVLNKDFHTEELPDNSKESYILCLSYKVKTNLVEFWSARDSQVLQFLVPLDSIESRNWNEIESTVIREGALETP